MACATGIPPSVWAAEGDRAIATAALVLEEAARKFKTDDEDDDRQMSG